MGSYWLMVMACTDNAGPKRGVAETPTDTGTVPPQDVDTAAEVGDTGDDAGSSVTKPSDTDSQGSEDSRSCLPEELSPDAIMAMPQDVWGVVLNGDHVAANMGGLYNTWIQLFEVGNGITFSGSVLLETTGSQPMGVTEDYLLVALMGGGLQAIQSDSSGWSDWYEWTELSSTEGTWSGWLRALHEDRAYLANVWDGQLFFDVFDIGDPGDLMWLGATQYEATDVTEVRGIDASSTRVAVTTGLGDLRLFLPGDGMAEATPYQSDNATPPEELAYEQGDVALQDEVAFLLNRNGMFEVVDLSAAESPEQLSQLDLGNPGTHLEASGELVWAAVQTAGDDENPYDSSTEILGIDVSNPEEPEVVSSYLVHDELVELDASDHALTAFYANTGLHRIDLCVE